MIIEKVKIKDFRSHRLTELDFDEGITVIIGGNGSGKTSILDAINFALFKQRPEKVNMDDMIRIGSKETKVTVVFHAGGSEFMVERGRRPKKPLGSALYELKGSQEMLIAEGEDEITDEIKKISKLNGEIFTSAIYIRQGEIDRLLSATPSARKVQVGKLLGAEDLENAHKHMRDLIDEYKIKIGSKQTVYEEIKKVENAILKENQAIYNLKRELTWVSKRLKSKRPLFDETEQKIELLGRIKDLENQIKENQTKKDNLNEKLESISQYEKILEETEDAHKRYIKIEDEIEKIKEKRAGLLKYFERDAHLKKRLESDSKRLKEIKTFISSALVEAGQIFQRKIETYGEIERLTRKGIKESEEELKGLLKEKEKLSSKIGKLEGKNEEIKRSVGELKTAKEKCPLCNADLTPEHKSELLEDFSQKIRKNEKLIHTVEKKIQGYKNAKLRLEKFKRKLEGINLELLKSKIDEKVRMEEGIKKREIEIVEIKKYLEETELLKKELVETEKRKNMLEEKNEGYIGARQFLRKNRPEKEGIKLEIEKLENKIRGLQEKIDKIIKKVGYKPEISLELERLKKDKRRLLNELTELEKAKSRNGSVIEEKERSTKNRKNELKELKDKREDLKKLEEFKVLLARIRGFFHKDVLQKELRVRSKPLVESYTRDVFDSFDLPYSDIALTDDFDLIVYGPLGEESSEMLSGGERIASALALRIGIAKALSGSAMELIILDEPTTHLDIIRRRDLVDIIKRLSSIPQTIVVTHDKEFENAADTMIEVEKIEGVSRVRYVD